MPGRRTFATGLVPFAYSEKSELRPPGSARISTPSPPARAALSLPDLSDQKIERFGEKR